MNETEFHLLAGSMLSMLSDRLEEADEQGAIEIECDDSALSIDLPSGKQLLVSKHTPTRQLWFSSPVSGGLHFIYDAAAKKWKLPDGRILPSVLAQELKTLANVEVQF